MKLLVTNIGILAGIGHEGKRCLRGAEMSQLNTIENAYLYVENGRIVSYGPRIDTPQVGRSTLVVDAEGGTVMPSFCDSHTHVVYAGSREGEFVDKIRGLKLCRNCKAWWRYPQFCRPPARTFGRRTLRTSDEACRRSYSKRYGCDGNKEWLWFEP